MSTLDPMLPGRMPSPVMARAPAPAIAPRLPRAARALLSMLERLRHGRLRLVMPDGTAREFGRGSGPRAEWRLANWKPASALLRRGDIGFAEGWLDGDWTTDDLPALLELASLEREALDLAIHGTAAGRLLDRLRHLLLRANTRRGSRRNISAHYDLGNDFYALWLDETMTYSSAWFAGRADQPLADAQHAKYAHAMSRLDLWPGSRVLEIGCGWGGFAEVAARASHHVTGLTLSREQLAWAQARLEAADLDHRTDLRLQDYRDTTGSFDGIVSIEMFEAVGERWWPTWFSTVERLLAPGARAVVQTITIRDDRFERYRRGVDFIQTHVFPGGMLPSPARFEAEAGRAGLRVAERHPFGPDYARTLAEWRRRFEAALPQVRAMGFDERFVRLWRFYLSYCEAGFRTGDLDVVQYVLERR